MNVQNEESNLMHLKPNQGWRVCTQFVAADDRKEWLLFNRELRAGFRSYFLQSKNVLESAPLADGLSIAESRSEIEEQIGSASELEDVS